MEYVKGFRDLHVYKLARESAKEVFDITKKFPQRKGILSPTSFVEQSDL